MGRLLSIDYGTKRSGIAVSDPLQIIATPLRAVKTHELFDFLTDYFREETVDEVVVGWPTKDDGSPTNNTPQVEAFVNRFKKVFPDMKLLLHDEWNTSRLAVQSMVQAGVKKKDRRKKMNIDKTSAVIILQSYMESKA